MPALLAGTAAPVGDIPLVVGGTIAAAPATAACCAVRSPAAASESLRQGLLFSAGGAHRGLLKGRWRQRPGHHFGRRADRRLPTWRSGDLHHAVAFRAGQDVADRSRIAHLQPGMQVVQVIENGSNFGLRLFRTRAVQRNGYFFLAGAAANSGGTLSPRLSAAARVVRKISSLPLSPGLNM